MMAGRAVISAIAGCSVWGVPDNLVHSVVVKIQLNMFSSFCCS